MNAFIWMFKEKDFKNHFIALIKWIFILSIIPIVLTAFFFLYPSEDFLVKTSFIVLIPLFCLFPCLLPMGYFWELTENMIDRTYEIQSSSVFDGKIKKVYKIKLPEFRVGKFIWRGFASIIANIIMFALYVFLIFLHMKNTVDYQLPLEIYIPAWILLASLIPALLWNYAKQNSIFAMLNFPKAIYIISNYFFRYIGTLLLLLLLCGVNAFLDNFVVQGIIPFIKGNFDFQDLSIIVGLLIYSVFLFLKDLYLIFVISYVLANIVPESEN